MKLKELPPLEWPLTHSERIRELADLSRDPSQYHFRENILGAIRYHRIYDPNDLCSGELVYFQIGKQIGPNERWCLTWFPSCHSLFLVGLITLYRELYVWRALSSIQILEEYHAFDCEIGMYKAAVSSPRIMNQKYIISYIYINILPTLLIATF